jgi:ribosome-associated heat shock protein Hsp15
MALRLRLLKEVKVGDLISVTAAGGVFGVAVTGLAEMRGSAALAATLYVESAESKEARLKVAAERKVLGMFAAAPVTKPSKRDRREILRFRGRD